MGYISRSVLNGRFKDSLIENHIQSTEVRNVGRER